MATVTTEFEITSSVPAPKLFKAFADYDNIVTKIDPNTFKSIDIIQGNGGAGTIKKVTYGDAVPYTYSKHKVDAMDADTLTGSYTIFEGDVLSGGLESSTHHLKYIPSADGGCVFKHSTVYKCKGSDKPTEEVLNQAKEAYAKTFKDIEAYVKANPNAY